MTATMEVLVMEFPAWYLQDAAAEVQAEFLEEETSKLSNAQKQKFLNNEGYRWEVTNIARLKANAWIAQAYGEEYIAKG